MLKLAKLATETLVQIHPVDASCLLKMAELCLNILVKQWREEVFRCSTSIKVEIHKSCI